MAEKVGLLGVLDLKDFNRSYGQYLKALDNMNSKTSGFASGADSSFTGLGNNFMF